MHDPLIIFLLGIISRRWAQAMCVCGLLLEPWHRSMIIVVSIYQDDTLLIKFGHYFNLYTRSCCTSNEPHADELDRGVPGPSNGELWTPSFLLGIFDTLIGKTSSSAFANTFSVGSSTTVVSALDYQMHTRKAFPNGSIYLEQSTQSVGRIWCLWQLSQQYYHWAHVPWCWTPPEKKRNLPNKGGVSRSG